MAKEPKEVIKANEIKIVNCNPASCGRCKMCQRRKCWKCQDMQCDNWGKRPCSLVKKDDWRRDTYLDIISHNKEAKS